MPIIDSYFVWPASLGFAGAVLLIGAAGFNAGAALAGGALLASGIWAGRLLLRRRSAQFAFSAEAAAGEVSRMIALFDHSAPVWVRQIETARGEADRSVAGLAELFGGIVAKLERVLRGSGKESARGGDGRREAIAAIGRNKAELHGVLEILRSVQAARNAIVTEVNANAIELTAMAAEVHQIALLVRLLTINAAVEAARSRETGRAFSVIVSELRQLAARSSAISEGVSRQVRSLNSAVAGAFRGSGHETDAHASSTQKAEAAIQQVVERFESVLSGLTDSVDAMERERADVRQDISRALVLLQFQDRVSQILSHVARDLDELPRQLEKGAAGGAGDTAWAERMARGYTTAEEFDNLRGAPRSAARAAAEVTYF